MRLFHRFTRYLVSAATTAHIGGLRFGVKLNTAKLTKAMRRTDAGIVAVHQAEKAVVAAKDDLTALSNAEAAVLRENSAYYTAARNEARALRPSEAF